MELTAIGILVFIALGLFVAVLSPYLRKWKERGEFQYRYLIPTAIVLFLSIGYAQELAKFFTSSAGDNIIFVAFEAFLYGFTSQYALTEIGKVYAAVNKWLNPETAEETTPTQPIG